MRRAIGVGLVLVLAHYLNSEAGFRTVARVIDGDTFALTDSTRVRILGIDALEDHFASTLHPKALIEGKYVELVSEGETTDKYGRTLAYVSLPEGADVGAQMVKDGYAITYLKYPCSRQSEYLQFEIDARREGLGIWASHLKSSDAGSGALASTSAALASSISSAFSKVDSSAETVYITKSGTKYHRDGCSYLSKSKSPIPLSDAVGTYDACSKCDPPVLTSNSPNTALSPRAEPQPSTTSGSQYKATPTYSGTSRQCAATTKKGTRCKRSAKAGSSYCWQHGG